MILRKVLFCEVGAPESSFLGLKAAWLLGQCIVWILNNPRFNNWFKDQRDGKISSFCQISQNRVFGACLKYLVEGLVIP